MQIIKHFSNLQAFNAEMDIYRLGLPMVPKLIDYQTPLWIRMEKIKGTPYLDGMHSFFPELLGRTIAAFHLATYADGVCLCHIDNQPQNILFDGDKYFLIDFEDSRYELPEVDIAHLLLFWAVDFPHEKFMECAKDFLEAYHAALPIREEYWTRSLNKSIGVFFERRRRYGKADGKNAPGVQSANLYWLMSYVAK